MREHITTFPDVLEEGEKIIAAWGQAVMHHVKPTTHPIGNVDSAIQLTKTGSKKVKNYATYKIVLLRTDLNERASQLHTDLSKRTSKFRRKAGRPGIPTSLKPRDGKEIIHEYQDCVYMIGSSATGLIITGVGAFILPHMTVGVAVNTFILQHNIRKLRKVVKEAKERGLPLGQVDTTFAIVAGILTKLAFIAVTFGHDDFLTIAQGYEAIFSHFGLDVVHPHVLAAMEHAQQLQSAWVNDPLVDPLVNAANAPADAMKEIMPLGPSTWHGPDVLESTIVFGPASEMNIVTLVLEDPVMKVELRGKDVVKNKFKRSQTKVSKFK
jgi:hypothetical protein